jgi:hypothetical protein
MMRAHINLAGLLAKSSRIDEALAALDCALEIARATGQKKTARQLRALRAQYRGQKASQKTP